jgi:hypothetical protein
MSKKLILTILIMLSGISCVCGQANKKDVSDKDAEKQIGVVHLSRMILHCLSGTSATTMWEFTPLEI